MEIKDLEIWKPVVGYEGSYEVSNLGNVRGLDRLVHRKSALGKEQMVPVKGKTMTKRLNEQGYYKVDLSKVVDGKKSHKGFLVSRLVAIAFIPNTYNKPFVNHINGIPKDNHINNLEWVTASENTQHAYDNGLLIRPKGEDNPNSKISNIQANEIKNTYIKGTESLKSIGKRFGVSRHTISRIVKGTRYA